MTTRNRSPEQGVGYVLRVQDARARRACSHDTQSLPRLRPDMGTPAGGAGEQGSGLPHQLVCVPAVRMQSLHGPRTALPRFHPDGVVMRCTLWRRLPPSLVQDARQQSATGYVDSAVQCQLPAHTEGAHYGLLDEGSDATALWLRWQGTEADLSVLPDCPAVAPEPDGDGCSVFAGHADRHTWEEAHPPRETLCTN